MCLLGFSSDGGDSQTPPSSPTPNRRGNREDSNVFSRLTSQTHVQSPVANRGMINNAATTRSKVPGPLQHSHTADGHTKAVLSVFSTEDMLFSSSKDRTAKVWDLATGTEVLSLSGHPNNVISVKYSEETKLLYTVSTYFIKVWDLREGNKCVKSLTSSGLTNDGSMNVASSTRHATCPPGETNINDIALNSTGSMLYSAAGNTVKLWDLRSFKAVGKLSGGHQAAVMVLAVDDTDTADGNICVVTGSKDHYIKVFEVMDDSTGLLTPKCNLEPPHYDGIQSLCLMGDLLFSGSRDTCIKKWDLAEQKLNQSINNSHRDWITGLAFMPGGNALLSGCRGGFLKIWHIDSCQQLGEIRAHISPVNAIATNSRLIFTAANEGGIKIWEPAWDQMPENVQELYV